jgi:CheY-like chemotaxis protein
MRTFLVLDDNADNRYLAAHALKRGFPGAQILEAATTQQAVVLAQQTRPDGIITDHHLGVEDGIAFIRDIRKTGLDCPVVMVTASSDPKVHQLAYNAGAARVFAGSQIDFVSYFQALFDDAKRT